MILATGGFGADFTEVGGSRGEGVGCGGFLNRGKEESFFFLSF